MSHVHVVRQPVRFRPDPGDWVKPTQIINFLFECNIIRILIKHVRKIF